MWGVFTLFVIPIGGGIPAGVLLAQKEHIPWPIIALLYFLSDVALAFTFEPLMLGVIVAGKKFPFLARLRDVMRKSTARTIAGYGTRLRPHTLVLISFGVDPMTGRAATKMAGHGFLAGWALAILGDMFFFALLMASTLWLHNVLGDGTAATVAILVTMMAVPYVVRRLRQRFEQAVK